jgi:protoporphyrinogen oxidase
VILGAGATGLGTALGLALHGYGGRVLLVEKKAVPGGLAGSFRWKHHTVDHGPHRLSPNITRIRVLAEELLGPDCLIKKSQHGVQFGGKLYQFPPRVIDWITPASLWHAAAFVASFLAAQLGWIVWRFSPDTFETTVVRKFGRRFFERIAAPMAEKVWTDPAEIDPAFVNQRFAQVHPVEVLKRLAFPRQELNPSIFYYPRRGYQQLWDSLADYLVREGQTILYDSQPTRLEVERDRIVRITVVGPDGERTVEGPDLTVVSTLPIASLVGLLAGLDTAALREHVRELKIRSMILALFEFDLPRALPYRTLIFPERAICFNRLFEQNEYSRETVAAGRSVVVADVTVPRGDPRLEKSDEDLIAMVRADLAKLPYIRLDRLTDAAVKRIEFAYVVPDLATRRRIYYAHHDLKRIANLVLVGRFAVGEYDNSDYAIDNGITLGAMLSGRIAKLDYLCTTYDNRQRYIVG